MAQQSRGAPYPLGTDANNTAADLQALALWANERPGITPVTTTQRNAITGIERWDGRVVLDTTLDRLFRWDAGTSTWIQIPDSGDIAALLATTGLPAAPAATATRGVSASAARADHVHPTTQIAYTNITMNAGWTGQLQYARASGIVTIQMSAAKTSWANNEAITAVGAIPVGSRPPGIILRVGINSNDNSLRGFYCDTAGTLYTAVGGSLSNGGNMIADLTYVAAP